MSTPSPYDPPRVLSEVLSPPPMEVQSDEGALRVVSWLYYVAAAFEAVVGLICVVMLLQASFALSRATPRDLPGRGLPRMPNLGGMFDSLLVYVVVMVVLSVVVHVLCGYFLRRRTKYTFCVAVAVVTCLSFPLGTLLGVGSLMVLMRPGVKRLFGRPSGAPLDAGVR